MPPVRLGYRRKKVWGARKSTFSILVSAADYFPIGGLSMRLPTPVVFLALLLFLLLPGQGRFSSSGQATAQPASMTPEQIYWNCRRAIFAKYGQRVTRNGRPDAVMYSQTATQMVDECVLRYKHRAARAPT